MSVFDRFMSVFDRFMSVFDRFMSVFDRFMSVFDRFMMFFFVYGRFLSFIFIIQIPVERLKKVTNDRKRSETDTKRSGTVKNVQER
jgi:hypothetical protein